MNAPVSNTAALEPRPLYGIGTVATVPMPYNGLGSNAAVLLTGAFICGSCLPFDQLYAQKKTLDRRNRHFV